MQCHLPISFPSNSHAASLLLTNFGPATSPPGRRSAACRARHYGHSGPMSIKRFMKILLPFANPQIADTTKISLYFHMDINALNKFTAFKTPERSHAAVDKLHVFESFNGIGPLHGREAEAPGRYPARLAKPPEKIRLYAGNACAPRTASGERRARMPDVRNAGCPGGSGDRLVKAGRLYADSR